MNKEVREEVDKLREGIISVFGSYDVMCVLLHGSALFNPHIQPQDIDIVIVLRQKGKEDCLRLRNLVIQLQLSRLPIHLHLIYLEEIPANADFFSLHTCGPFFVCHLRRAEVLFGENVFDIVFGPSDYQLQLSLLQKIQQYTFQIRNLVFSPVKVSERELRQARKKSIVVLKDLLMSEGKIVQQEAKIVHESMGSFPDFSREEIEFLRVLIGGWVIPSSDESALRFLEQCLAIHERAYQIMRKRIATGKRCKFLL